MVKTKVILLLCFVAAFVAGGTAGYVVKTSTEAHPRGHSRLADELKLTDRQREQMGNIWASMEPNGSQQREQRRQAADARDKAILDLMNPEQQSKYDQVLQDYERRLTDLRKQAADERDKAIVALMTPEQQSKYDQIRQDYERRMSELAAQRKLAFDRAVERTKKEVLTPEQAGKYEEMLKQREAEFGGRAWGGQRGRRGGPRTRPAAEESNAPA